MAKRSANTATDELALAAAKLVLYERLKIAHDLVAAEGHCLHAQKLLSGGLAQQAGRAAQYCKEGKSRKALVLVRSIRSQVK